MQGGILKSRFINQKCPLEFMGAFRKVVSSTKNATLNSGGILKSRFIDQKYPLEFRGAFR
jgi:hypothetical protein